MGLQMKKRWAIVMLGCIIGSALGIAPLLDSLGCSRVEDAAADIESIGNNGAAEDSAKWHNIHRSERSEAHLRSDSIRDAKRKTEKSVRKKKGKKKVGKRSGKQDSKKQDRSLRDETL